MKKIIMASLIILSFTSCIPLAIVGGAAAGAAGAVAAQKFLNGEKKITSTYSSDVSEVIK